MLCPEGSTVELESVLCMRLVSRELVTIVLNSANDMPPPVLVGGLVEVVVFVVVGFGPV